MAEVTRVRVIKDGTAPPAADWRYVVFYDDGSRVESDTFPSLGAIKAEVERLHPDVPHEIPLGGSRKD